MQNRASEQISHKGVVCEIAGSVTKVKIVQEAACNSCHAKGVCGAADQMDKIIDVATPEGFPIKIGAVVVVEMASNLGLRAVFWGYFLPFLLMLFTLILCTSLDMDQGLSALLSVALLAPYYFVLYLLREKMKARYQFRIRKERIDDI